MEISHLLRFPNPYNVDLNGIVFENIKYFMSENGGYVLIKYHV